MDDAYFRYLFDDPVAAFDELVDIGKREAFEELNRFNPEHRCWWRDSFGNPGTYYVSKLSHEDYFAFIKSVTMIEIMAGSLGSATNLEDFGIFEHPDVLDWVLRNYPDFYYSRGAKNADEYYEIVRELRKNYEEYSAKKAAHENTRRLYNIKKATRDIFDAVRRNDLVAVKGLIRKKADVFTVDESGISLLDIAKEYGNQKIIATLINSMNQKSIST